MQRLFGEYVRGRGAWGLLILRIMAGSALLLHGWPKIQHPFGWMPDGAIPGPFLALSALAEFGGGLALLLGLLMPVVAIGLVVNFVVAIGFVMQKGAPYVSSSSSSPSWEPAAFYLATALLMLLTGPGELSVDALLFNNKVKSGE